MKEITTLLVILFLTVLLLPIFTIYNCFAWGYVATVFFEWYIQPLNLGIPVFNIWQYAGIMMFLVALMPKIIIPQVEKEYRESDITYIVNVSLTPWVILLSGWIFHSIMY